MNLFAAYGTVSDIEILFTLLALAGSVFSAWNLKDTLGDWHYAKNLETPNGRKILARTTVKAESARLVKQLLFVTAGLIAMSLPEPPNADLPAKLVISGFFFRWVFIIAAALTAYQSYLSYKVRKDLLGPFGH